METVGTVNFKIPKGKCELDRLRKTAIELLIEVNELQIPFSLQFYPNASLTTEVRRFERQVIEYALDQSNWNQVEAARLLNLSYSTLNAKIKRYGIVEDVKRSATLIARKSTTEVLESHFPSADDATRIRSGLKANSLSNRLRLIKSVILQLVEKIDSLGFSATSRSFDRISLPDEMRQFEIHLIRSALDRTGGNQSRAAKILSVSATTLNNKIKRLKIRTSQPFHEKASNEKPLMLQNAND